MEAPIDKFYVQRFSERAGIPHEIGETKLTYRPTALRAQAMTRPSEKTQ